MEVPFTSPLGRENEKFSGNSNLHLHRPSLIEVFLTLLESCLLAI